MLLRPKANLMFVLLAAFSNACLSREDLAKSAQPTLDGWYSQFPAEGSDSGQLTIPLTALLFEKLPLQKDLLVDRITSVRIRVDHGSLRVDLRDSAGRLIPIERGVPIDLRRLNGGENYVLTRNWSLEGSGETGASRGKVTTTFTVDHDGSLRADTLREFESGPRIWGNQPPVHRWKKYPKLRDDGSLQQP